MVESSLTIVRARLRLEGSKEYSEGIILVDTGASVTVVDREMADKVGVTYVKRTSTLTTASGHKMEGELAVIDKLIVEREELPYAHLLILKIPEGVKEMLRSKQLSDWGMIGLTTLELLNLMPDITTGKLKKTESFMLL
jgi:predicted aspartyl protease